MTKLTFALKGNQTKLENKTIVENTTIIENKTNVAEDSSTFNPTSIIATTVAGIVVILIALKNWFKKKPDEEGQGTNPYLDDDHKPDDGDERTDNKSNEKTILTYECPSDDEEDSDWDPNENGDDNNQNDKPNQLKTPPKETSNASKGSEYKNTYNTRSSEKKNTQNDSIDDHRNLDEVLSLDSLNKEETSDSKIAEYTGYTLAGAAISYAVYSADLETLGSTLIGASENSHSLLEGLYSTAF